MKDSLKCLETIYKEGRCKCPQCKEGYVYPYDRERPAKGQHFFTCDVCGDGVSLQGSATIE